MWQRFQAPTGFLLVSESFGRKQLRSWRKRPASRHSQMIVQFDEYSRGRSLLFPCERLSPEIAWGVTPSCRPTVIESPSPQPLRTIARAGYDCVDPSRCSDADTI